MTEITQADRERLAAEALRDLMATRLRLSAKLNTELAAGMTGHGQNALRDHFLSCAKLMLDAAAELTQRPTQAREG
jgi:hypothetical protein